jgi:hypothetical protein
MQTKQKAKQEMHKRIGMRFFLNQFGKTKASSVFPEPTRGAHTLYFLSVPYQRVASD